MCLLRRQVRLIRPPRYFRLYSSWFHMHEYGGTSVIFWDVIYFSHIRDHRVYKTTKGGDPHRSLQVILTSQPVQILAQLYANSEQGLADLTVHQKHRDLIVCSAKDYTNPPSGKGTDVSRLAQYHDFYACARSSSEGRSLVRQQW